MSLIPGALYKYKCDGPYDDKSIIRTGIFVKQKTYSDPEWKFWVFKMDRYTKISLNASYVTYKIDTSPALAKQVARGLCDRIPEDCAGIIERMLVGDSIVGHGPDRYPERRCDTNGVYHA